MTTIEVVVGGDPVDDQIVDDAARRQAGHGVERAAVGEPGDVVGDEALHRLGGARAAEVDLAHVADVEHAHRRARRAVLVEDAAGVLTGIAQPPKSTIFAPRRRCAS